MSKSYAKYIFFDAEASIEFNDNIYRSFRNPEYDFITKINPKLAIEKKGKYNYFNMNIGIDYNFYWKNTRIYNIGAITNLNYKNNYAEFFTFNIEDSLIVQKQTTPSGFKDIGIRMEKIKYLYNFCKTSFIFNFTKKIYTDIIYYNEFFIAKEDSHYNQSQSTSKSLMNGGEIKLNYIFEEYKDVKDSVYLGCSFKKNVYYDIGNTNTWTISCGLKKKLFKYFQISPSIEHHFIRDINNKQLSETSYGIIFDYMFNPVMRISLTLQTINNIYTLVTDIYNTKMIYFLFMRRITKTFSIYLKLSYSRTSFQEIRMWDKIPKISANFIKNFSDHFSIDISYSYENIGSNSFLNKYQSNMAAVKVCYTF